MIPEFSGIERRLDELNERLARLAPFREKKRSDFDEDAYLRDIVERNLEIAAQCCIDISHRIISLEKAQKPRDYYEAIIRTYFSKKPEVIAVYLFGSQESGKQRLDSDVEIGILLRHKDLNREDELREQVIVELSRILKKDIHPVFMNTAGEELLRQIFSKGKCVQTNDSKLRAQFMTVSL